MTRQCQPQVSSRKLWKPDWAACFAPFSAVRQYVEIGYSITTTCRKTITTTYNNHHHERKSHVTIALTIALIFVKIKLFAGVYKESTYYSLVTTIKVRRTFPFLQSLAMYVKAAMSRCLQKGALARRTSTSAKKLPKILTSRFFNHSLSRSSYLA